MWLVNKIDMVEIDRILDKNAKGTMTNWDLDNFKKSHPALFKVIVASLKDVAKDTFEVAHQAGRFEGKGIAEENWVTFEWHWKDTYEY